MRKLRFLMAGFLVVAGGQTARANVALLDNDGWKISIGGFAEFDFLHDTTRSLTEVMGSGPIDRPGTVSGDQGRTQFTLRNTRFLFSIVPPKYDDWYTRVYLESDFLGYDPAPSTAAPTNSESNFFTAPAPRLRHAYFQAVNGGWQFLVGQYWSLFGGQAYYFPDTVDVMPITGIAFNRTPQFRIVHAQTAGDILSQIGLSIERPVQRDSELPSIVGALFLGYSGWRAPHTSTYGGVESDPMSVTISAMARDITQTDHGVSYNKLHYLGGAVAIDMMLPIIGSSGGDISNTLSLSGEYTIGRGYSDMFGGFSANLPQFPVSASQPNLDAGFAGYTLQNEFQLVQLRSFNVALQYHFSEKSHTWIDFGYSALHSDNAGRLVSAAGKIIYDDTQSLYANLFHDFTDHIRLGVEYARYQTRYIDGVAAHNSRLMVSGWFRF